MKYKFFLVILILLTTNISASEYIETPRANQPEIIMTVTGPVKPSEIGLMLPHEHLVIDFIGADKTGPHRFKTEEAVKAMLPYIEQVKERNFNCIAECTPAWIGRDVRAYKKLSEKSGVKILTNTGIYGSADDKFVPKFAYEQTAEQLAKRYIKEFREGIDGTSIRPGFIKTATDKAPLSEIDKKLVLAAASASLETGLAVACHIVDTNSALEVLDIVTKEGVPADSLIIVHAQNISDTNAIATIARTGAWIEYDCVRPDNIERNVEFVKMMIDAGFLERLLLSHDAGWYDVNKKDGGDIRDYNAIADNLIPALKEAGITEEQFNIILIKNPRKAFSIKIPKATTD